MTLWVTPRSLLRPTGQLGLRLRVCVFTKAVWFSDAKEARMRTGWASQVAVAKNPPANSEAVGLTPGSGRASGVENGSPLQYSRLENSMDRRARWATVHGY